MLARIEKAIAYSFYALFFLVPLVLHPKTSELFEFNKMVLTYALTVVIVALWLTRSVLVKKLYIRRTILDIPLVIFLASQLLSTITSVDFRISLLGYYSRYHGGLMSTVSYSLLYWAFVSNLSKKEAKKTILSMLFSATLVSIYGVLEHLGIDKELWVQDVQLRVFSTLGQPNWLAAWLVALTPLTWALALDSKLKIKDINKFDNLKSKFLKNYWLWTSLSSLFFLTLIYTKSRSGFIGFAPAWATFWSVTLLYKYKAKRLKKNLIIKSLIINVVFLLFIVTSGTQWTPSVFDYIKQINKSNTDVIQVQEVIPKEDEVTSEVKFQAPALVIGGSASTEIRKIVWTGAIDIWKNYPILGTGVETFAVSYYNFRPVEHNLVSEWDFLYNKAHNEYLNFMATTGTIGTLSYLGFILAVLIQFSKSFNLKQKLLSFFQNSKKKVVGLSTDLLSISLFSGFISILITNFFGFSVVPVGLQFFLYPAFAVVLSKESKREKPDINTVQPTQKTGIAIISIVALILLYSISKYWYADLQYSLGKAHNDVGNHNRAREYLVKATKLSPKETSFWEELSDASTNVALSLGKAEGVDQTLLAQVVQSAINESRIAVSLSPKNVNTKRKQASMYIKLSVYDPQLLLEGQKVLKDAIDLAPTEAKLWYNYALTFMRTGQLEKSKEILEKTIEMKPNYKNARLAYGLVLSDLGETERAIEELEYILEYVAPNDKLTKQQLDELKAN